MSKLLQAENAELLRDRARLNWLEQLKSHTLYCHIDGTCTIRAFKSTRGVPTWNVMARRKPIREALDSLQPVEEIANTTAMTVFDEARQTIEYWQERVKLLEDENSQLKARLDSTRQQLRRREAELGIEWEDAQPSTQK